MEVNRMQNTIQGIRKYYPVSDNSIQKLVNQFEEHHLPKNYLLTRAGVLDHHAYFIEKGCTRTYFLVEGKEVTNWFSKEGDITFSSDSMYHREAGHDFVQLLEDSTIYAIPIDILNELYKTDLDIANWSRAIHQEVLLRMQNLRIDRMTLDSGERYEKFLRENPGLINRVSLGCIASYLGMSQQHLSAVRANG